ncbi:MAG: hypothetical protein ACRDGQ_13510, partial [Candidatus Limnocylindrales bacterium]
VGGGAMAQADDSAARERERLERELAGAEAQLAATRARLANDAFVRQAPPAVVEGTRTRQAELTEQVRRLAARLRA